MFKVITGTLQANHNTMQLTDDTITNDSIFEVYADTENVIPSSVSVGGHTVTVTFDSKPSSNVGIKVLINNIVGEYTPSVPIPEINYHDNTGGTGLEIGYIQEIVGTPPHPVNTPVYNGITDDMLVPSDTVLGGVLYHATTGNTWKKLDASNINYDNVSTIYSAMGDIDELETVSKNLVAAINEVKDSGGSELSFDAYYPDDNNVEHSIGNNLYRMHFSGTASTEYLTIDSNIDWRTVKIIDTSAIARKNNGQLASGYISSGWRTGVHVGSNGNLLLVSGGDTRDTFDVYVTYRKVV